MEVLMLNISYERQRLNLDQEQFAKKIGVSKSTVSRWERGVQFPYGSDLIAMRELCGCSIDWLLGVTNDRTQY